MSEQDFLQRCDRLLGALEDALDHADLELESSRQGQVLELEFEDRSRMVINGNAPLREIWVASRAGGFHFRLEAGRWMDTRGAGELYACLSRWISEQSGSAVLLAAPAEG